MLIQATEQVMHVGSTLYVGANPEYQIMPPIPMLGIMQPEVVKSARGRPFVKVRRPSALSRRERRALRNA